MSDWARPERPRQKNKSRIIGLKFVLSLLPSPFEIRSLHNAISYFFPTLLVVPRIGADESSSDSSDCEPTRELAAITVGGAATAETIVPFANILITTPLSEIS